MAPLLLAQGVVLAGMIANRILYAGATLPEFKVELIGVVALLVFAVLGPLLVFSPQLFQLGLTTLVPVLPLMLTMISLEELLQRLLPIIF